MLRKTIGVFAGIAIAVMIFMGFERILDALYPAPKVVDISDYVAKTNYEINLPNSALLLNILGWIIGSFICGLVIKIIDHSNSKTPAYIAGLFLMSAGIVAIFAYPHPIWYYILSMIVFIPFSILGHSIYIRKNKA